MKIYLPKDVAPGEEFSSGLAGLVFDVDGVMFDSRNSNIEYYNLIRRAVQLPSISAAEEEFCHMATVDEALSLIIPSDYKAAAEKACKAINYQEQILPLLSVEPGLLELLHWLQQWGVRMAICTNRTNSVESLLRYFGLESFFNPVKTAGNSLPKPNPDGLLSILDAWNLGPHEVAFLGDSKVDEMAAKAAGMPFWAFRSNQLTAQLHFPDFFKLIHWITPLVEGQ